MRKLSLCLSSALIICLMLVVGVFAQKGDVFDVEENNSQSAPGYIFALKDNADLPKETDTLYNLGENIYYTLTLDELKTTCSADDIEYIEANAQAVFCDEPNDTYYSSDQKSYMDLINAQTFWDYDFEGAGVTVAVVDTGIANHEDIDSDRVQEGYNFAASNTNTADTNGHGTFITGIISATRNNNIGVAGLLNEVTLAPVKISSTGSLTSSNIIQGIYYAVDTAKANVINLSLGLSSDYASVKKAVEYAENKGVIVVAAVGNSGADTLLYPAAYDTTVGVGNVDPDGIVSVNSQHNDSVYVTAPGCYIYSTACTSEDSYKQGSGTSYSAPFVTAMAAAAKSVMGDDLTPEVFKSLLKQWVNDAGDEGWDEYYGYGIIDLKLMAEYLDAYQSGNEDYLTLVSQVYINGKNDGTFEPDGYMTRAQAAQILYNLASDNSGTFTTSFSDVLADSWYYKAIAFVESWNIIEGYEDGTFQPDISVTRAEFVTMLSRLSDMEEGTSTFTDIDDHWAKAYIESAYVKGLVDGYDDSTFRPKENISRAEAVKIMNAILGRKIDNTTAASNPFTDVTGTHWAYYEILAAATEVA